MASRLSQSQSFLQSFLQRAVCLGLAQLNTRPRELELERMVLEQVVGEMVLVVLGWEQTMKEQTMKEQVVVAAAAAAAAAVVLGTE